MCAAFLSHRFFLDAAAFAIFSFFLLLPLYVMMWFFSLIPTRYISQSAAIPVLSLPWRVKAFAPVLTSLPAPLSFLNANGLYPADATSPSLIFRTFSASFAKLTRRCILQKVSIVEISAWLSCDRLSQFSIWEKVLLSAFLVDHWMLDWWGLARVTHSVFEAGDEFTCVYSLQTDVFESTLKLDQ